MSHLNRQLDELYQESEAMALVECQDRLTLHWEYHGLPFRLTAHFGRESELQDVQRELGSMAYRYMPVTYYHASLLSAWFRRAFYQGIKK